MLCDDCKQREAVFHSKIIKNGVSKEKHLCAQCQQKYAIPVMEDMGDLFTNFTQFMLGGSKTNENVICPQCGCTSEQFLESGYVGCSNCYKAFDRVMKPFIRKIQNDDRHTGKIPSSFKPTPETQLSALQSKLAQAVKEENFELCSSLSEQIRNLQAQGGEKHD